MAKLVVVLFSFLPFFISNVSKIVIRQYADFVFLKKLHIAVVVNSLIISSFTTLKDTLL